MGLTTAAGGFVVFLLSVSGVQGQWGVTFAPTQVCATKGSTVEMHCTYTYPSPYTVDKAFWFTKSDKVPLDSDSDYTGRVEYDCYENNCTLRITNLTGGDSAPYYFRFTTTPRNAYTGAPGVTLSVTELQLLVNEITVNPSNTEAKLKCQTTCTPLSFVWFKNGQEVPEQTNSYSGFLNPGDNISCALKGHEDYRSPTLYALKFPSVSVSPSGDIMEGSSVTLTCSSDANPAANYTWYKNDTYLYTLSEEPQLVFSSIHSSDSGLYHCAAENELGRRTTEYFIDVKYAPKLPSVSVSPSAEIVEGSSVTLTCSSDANPAANYTWYKNNQTLLQGPEGIYQFSSISSEDRGIYHCKSENQYGEINSPSLYLDVQYAPKLPAVAVCPSAEIVEGSTMNLICSSDANPAAKYTWYKENEDSPKASGQILVITDFRAEHSGNYYCEAQNSRGRHRFTIHLTVVADSYFTEECKLIMAGTLSALSVCAILIFVLLCIRKKRASKQPAQPPGKPNNRAQKQPAEQEDNIHYARINFLKKQADPVYANTIPAHLQIRKREKVDSVEYSTVKFNSGSKAPGSAAP